MGRRNYQGGTFTVSPDGERLKALRGSYPKQPPQHEVEKLAGVSRGQLTRYETGKPASAQDLKKLAEFYGVEPAELLSPEGLQMCNQILEEMCVFTNKSVVANTNGNRGVTESADVSSLKDEGLGHVGSTPIAPIHSDTEGRVSERLSGNDDSQANLEHEDDKSTRPLESSTAQKD